MRGLQAPTYRIIAAAYACAAIAVLVTWAALQFPLMGARFVAASPDAPVQLQVAGITQAALPPDSTVSFFAAGRRVDATVRDLPVANIPEASGDQALRRYALLDALDAVAGSHRVQLVLPGGREFSLTPTRPGLANLGADYWLLLFVGVASFLLGAWVFALRPLDWGARMLALSGVGMMGAAIGSALYLTRELGAPGLLMRAMIWLNFAGTQLCGGALIALFLRYPRPIARARHLLWIALPLCGLTVLVLAGVLPMRDAYFGMLLQFFVLIALLALQWRQARQDPLARAALVWIGLSTLFGTTAYVTMTLAPLLLEHQPLVSQGGAFLLLFAIYAGIAAGVGRYKLFDLDRWAYRILLAVGAALSLLLADAAMIQGLRLQPQNAVGLSILLVSIFYLPARGLLWRRVLDRAAMPEGALFEAMEQVRFADDFGSRHQRWRNLLARFFDPLEIREADDVVHRPAILNDGLALAIPAIGTEAPLMLRYAGQGRRLFSSHHVTIVTQLLSLMKSADAIREGYARGVAEERSRIARDLHDDVSGRLLTSLDRPSRALLREDVRTAVADIRTILRGLSGERLALSQVIANLRHETFTRLDAANIALEWPVDLAESSDPVLDYLRYRNISSAHREIVTNILRHAQASRVFVHHGIRDDILSLVVEDDGKGCTTKSEDGRGLANIARRLQEIGGAMKLTNSGKGFRVELSAPLRDFAQQASE